MAKHAPAHNHCNIFDRAHIHFLQPADPVCHCIIVAGCIFCTPTHHRGHMPRLHKNATDFTACTRPSTLAPPPLPPPCTRQSTGRPGTIPPKTHTHTQAHKHTGTQAHSTQHTARSTQHTAHSTQHTAHNTQHADDRNSERE